MLLGLAQADVNGNAWNREGEMMYALALARAPPAHGLLILVKSPSGLSLFHPVYALIREKASAMHALPIV